ncbi:MAG TPA: hypothetical protein VMU43_03325 [Candidatus Acidoferrum sp.]|nr:hypothetical protein [Candidatus Acidoferrum sp.]
MVSSKLNPARRGIEGYSMAATRTTRRTPRRATRLAKPTSRRAVKPVAKPAPKPVGKIASKMIPPPQVMFRLCRPGWAVIVEKAPNAQGTRFVCPFCPLSHRVPGPVRGFKKIRRAQYIKLRRVEE